MTSADILLAASAIAAEEFEKPPVEIVDFTACINAVSPGHALAVATRIAEATYTECVHDIDHEWFQVGRVYVYYPTEVNRG